MDFPIYLLLPLASSLIYVFGVLLIKRASTFGVGIMRTTFVANVVSAIVFTPLWVLGGTLQPVTLLWQPALPALLFLAGQLFTFHALNRGDVSVATPVLGIKLILVAVFLTLLTADKLSLKLWLAAGLSTLAIFLLNRSQGQNPRHVGETIVSAALAAASYALFDVLVQKWAPAWGTGRFLPIMFWMVGVCSFAFVPLFRAPLRAIPKAAWPWLLGGSLLIAIQAILLISTIATFGHAAAVNVIYSSRGLWSVLAVWLVGHWFENVEQHLPAKVLRARLAGAAIMLAAIVLVLMR